MVPSFTMSCIQTCNWLSSREMQLGLQFEDWFHVLFHYYELQLDLQLAFSWRSCKPWVFVVPCFLWVASELATWFSHGSCNWGCNWGLFSWFLCLKRVATLATRFSQESCYPNYCFRGTIFYHELRLNLQLAFLAGVATLMIVFVVRFLLPWVAS